jgi:hypothetical protein
MASQIFDRYTVESPNLPLKILEARREYNSCHIRLPGEDQRLSAIVVNGKYYSLFRVVSDRKQAIDTCIRLAARGDMTVITKTAKGCAIWVLESDAEPAPPHQPKADSPDQIPHLANCRILESRKEYQPCHIRVPDLDKRLAAVKVDGKYYGLLKVVDSREKALDLAARLQRRGDEAIITRLTQGDAVWVLEPEAYQDR